MTITSAIKKFFAEESNLIESELEPGKEKLKTNLYKIKLRIKRRIKNVKNPRKFLRKNLISHAYSNRYLLRGNCLFKKTQGLKKMRSFTVAQEEHLYSKLPAKIKKMEKRMFYTKEFYLNRGRPLLSKLRPKYAKLYISNKRKNTFANVSQSFTGKNFDKSFKVIFKASSGGNGFKGPKKGTQFARQES